MTFQTKAIFLDRDGVINQHNNNYVKSINEFFLLSTIANSIKILNTNNYKVIIITNQSVVNRKIISEETLLNIHDHMLKLLSDEGCIIDKIYYCPHRPDENCLCRKPKTGMIENAIADFNIDVKQSWLIGDSESDIIAGKSLNIQTIKMERNGKLIDVLDKLPIII